MDSDKYSSLGIYCMVLKPIVKNEPQSIDFEAHFIITDICQFRCCNG